jgi:acetyltransferase-like isoleucine patch superfamily enzyme
VTRTLPWDWYPGEIPANVSVDDTAYLETTFSFHAYRSEAKVGVRFGKGASAYLGTMFDVGRDGQVTLGDFALVHGARIICDSRIEIGDYALISWNVVLMDTRRAPRDTAARRGALESMAHSWPRRFPSLEPARPIRIGPNVWIGFDSCILPGVTIGEGAVVGARSVVAHDVPPHTVVAGNPARIVRTLDPNS